MKLHIVIDCDNDAFHQTEGSGAPAIEAGRILGTLGWRLQNGTVDMPCKLFDANGNSCGQATWEEDK